MSTRGWRVAAGLAALTLTACHRRAPATAPIPAPPGAPPTVQAPVESAPVSEGPVAMAPSTRDPQLRRFDVVSVEDTMITLLIGPERWVRRGTTGVAVDPRRRDALVARFRVVARIGDSATALVTGQTTRLSPTHVALIREPVPGALRQEVFWTGLFFGIAVGTATALLAKH